MTTDGAGPAARPALTPEGSNITPDIFGPSPSQTVGPYFHQGLIPEFQGVGGRLTVDPLGAGMQGVPGERIRLTGRLFDADGEEIPDAMIEVWQADEAGHYPEGAGAGFSGFARTHTRTPGARYEIDTVRPGAAAPDEAPRLWLWAGMRGLLTHLYTAVYFSDQDNGGDALLAQVPEHRRSTLIAERLDGPGIAAYTFDLYMQGERETVFFTP